LVGFLGAVTSVAFVQSQAASDQQLLNGKLENESSQKDIAIADKGKALIESERRRKQVSRYSRSSALLAYERSQSLAAQGETYVAVLWMGRALELAGEDSRDLHEPIRNCLAFWRRELHPVTSIHEDPSFLTAVLSPSCRLAFTTGPDERFRLWETATGRMRCEFDKPVRAAWDSRFRSDENLLAFEIVGEKLLFRDTATKRETSSIVPPASKGGRDSLRWILSPDCRRMLWQIDIDKVQILDIVKKKPLAPVIVQKGLCCAAFSPDSELLLTVSSDGTYRRWDARTGEPSSDLISLETNGTEAVVFLPDSRSFLAVGRDIRRVETATGKILDRANVENGVTSHTDPRLSRDGKILVTSASNNQRLVWDTSPLRAVSFGPATPLSTTMSPNGGFMGESSGDVWDLAARQRRGARIPQGLLGLNDSELWSRSGRALISRSLAPGTLVCSPMRQPGRFRDPETERVECAVVSPDGLMIVTGGLNGFCLWNAQTGQLLGTREPGRRVLEVRFGPDSRTVLTVDPETQRCWSVPDLEMRFSTPCTQQHVGTYSPDGTKVVIKTGDQRFELFQVESGKLLGEARPPTGFFRAGFDRSGRQVLTLGAGGLQLWDAAGCKAVGTPLHFSPGGVVSHLAITSDEGTLVTVGADRALKLWSLPSGKALGSRELPVGTIAHLALSHDGRLAAIQTQEGKAGGTVIILSLKDDKAMSKPLPTRGVCAEMAFSSDGRTLIAVGADNVQFWDVQTGASIDDPQERSARLIPDRDGRLVFPTPQPLAARKQSLFTPNGRAYLRTDRTPALHDTATGLKLALPIMGLGVIEDYSYPSSGSGLLVTTLLRDARYVALPSPATGDVEQLRLWAEVNTGLELTDDGQLLPLPADVWRTRHTRFIQSGGLK
jgi:WD40 repeat protein